MNPSTWLRKHSAIIFLSVLCSYMMVNGYFKWDTMNTNRSQEHPQRRICSSHRSIWPETLAQYDRTWGLKPSKSDEGDEEETTKEKKDKKKWHLHWWEEKKRKLDLFSLSLCFCVCGSHFYLNLTAGGWSVTEKYLTTEMHWSETNLSWLPPGRSPGCTFETGPGQSTRMNTNTYLPKGICYQKKKKEKPRTSHLGILCLIV